MEESSKSNSTDHFVLRTVCVCVHETFLIYVCMYIYYIHTYLEEEVTKCSPQYIRRKTYLP